jgi:hypothetical protein
VNAVRFAHCQRRARRSGLVRQFRRLAMRSLESTLERAGKVT